jgi:hypothetical protein
VSGAADFSHTGKIAGLEIRDLDGNVVPDAQVVTYSGIQYGAAAEAPEPDSVLLVAGGLLIALGAIRRRRVVV